MADLVAIPDAGTQAKIRGPIAVPVLRFITLGIYTIFWWYREMADLGRANGVLELVEKSILSVLALTIGTDVRPSRVHDGIHPGVGYMARGMRDSC